MDIFEGAQVDDYWYSSDDAREGEKLEIADETRCHCGYPIDPERNMCSRCAYMVLRGINRQQHITKRWY